MPKTMDPILYCLYSPFLDILAIILGPFGGPGRRWGYVEGPLRTIRGPFLGTIGMPRLYRDAQALLEEWIVTATGDVHRCNLKSSQL